MIRKDELVQVGYFAKPHGVKGELTWHTDYGDVFEQMENPYIVCEMDGLFVPFFIETIRPKNTSLLLVKFENINDELSAKKFSNKTAYCPSKIIGQPSVEVRDWSSFIGFQLDDSVAGKIGEVVDVDDSTINILFKIDYQGKELLMPMAEELIVSIDWDDRLLVVSLPEGLIDLYG